MAAEQQTTSAVIQWLPTLTALFTGGLAGALLNQLWQWIVGRVRRPTLALAFSDNVPGCEIETPAFLLNAQKIIVADGEQRYLRLRIANTGRIAAQNVNISLTNVSYTVPGAGNVEFAEEVFDLKLSLTDDKTVFNLAAGAHRFVDLVHTATYTARPVSGPTVGVTIPQPLAGCQAVYDFDFLQSPLRLQNRGFSRGRYLATIFASADNAASLAQQISWSWDETLRGVRIERLEFQKQVAAK
jgi:hypothetical protein